MTNSQFSHKKTFELIKKSLKETKRSVRERFIIKLRREQGYWHRFRYFLFLNPFFLFFVQIAILFIIIILAKLFNIKVLNSLIQLLFIYVSIILSLGLIPWFLAKSTPKLPIESDEIWREVLESYLNKLEIDIKSKKDQEKRKIAKQKLEKAILYYKGKGEALDFIIKLLSGIFINCLSDSDFLQKALITMDIYNLFEVNFLGGFCLIVIPFLFIVYHIKYKIPQVWMQNTLLQIEIDKSSRNKSQGLFNKILRYYCKSSKFIDFLDKKK